MQEFVLGFSGQIGSGKSTIAKELSIRLNWPYLSFGDYVRGIAKRRGLDSQREILQAIGTELVESNPKQFCELALSEIGWTSGRPLIVEGIRHVEILKILQEISKPLNFYLVFVTLNEDLRLKRLSQRDQSSLDTISLAEEDSTEIQVQSCLKDSADFVIDNNCTVTFAIHQLLTMFYSE